MLGRYAARIPAVDCRAVIKTEMVRYGFVTTRLANRFLKVCFFLHGSILPILVTMSIAQTDLFLCVSIPLLLFAEAVEARLMILVLRIQESADGLFHFRLSNRPDAP